MVLTRRHIQQAASAVLFGCFLVAGCAVGAWSSEWGGYRTSGNSPNGSFATIQGAGYNPGSNNCAVFSALLTNYGATQNRQLQVGLLRCGSNATVDGCDDAIVVEKLVTTSSGATQLHECFEHGSFSNSNQYSLKVQEPVDGSGDVKAYINGTPHEAMVNFNETVVAFAWGESTSNSCGGWNANGYFDDFQKRVFGSWQYVSGANPVTAVNNCWTLGSMNATGDFHAQR